MMSRDVNYPRGTSLTIIEWTLAGEAQERETATRPLNKQDLARVPAITARQAAVDSARKLAGF
jgi:hypothetical protein